MSNKDRSAESKAEDEPASSFLTVHPGSAQSCGQSASWSAQRCPGQNWRAWFPKSPFLSLEMREIIPGPPRGICFCSDPIQTPDYLIPLGDGRLKSNQYRAILSGHSRRLRRVRGGSHQNVTSADTRETGLQRSRETWAAPRAISGVPERNA